MVAWEGFTTGGVVVALAEVRMITDEAFEGGVLCDEDILLFEP